MATNNKRREATRRQLEQQLRQRQERARRRQRVTLISSIAGALVVIAAVIVLVVVFAGGNGSTPAAAGAGSAAPTSTAPVSSAATTPTTAASSSPAVKLAAPAACSAPSGTSLVTFDGVTIKNATDLTHAPVVTSTASADPDRLECIDLVAGKGAAATPTSTVAVQYSGVLYKNGTAFDSSWANGGKPVSFSLTGVVPGFTQGIGGTGKVAPMKVGGRRIVIMPSSLGYGAQAQGKIPANSPLVFVIDLTKVS